MYALNEEVSAWLVATVIHLHKNGAYQQHEVYGIQQSVIASSGWVGWLNKPLVEVPTESYSLQWDGYEIILGVDELPVPEGEPERFHWTVNTVTFGDIVLAKREVSSKVTGFTFQELTCYSTDPHVPSHLYGDGSLEWYPECDILHNVYGPAQINVRTGLTLFLVEGCELPRTMNRFGFAACNPETPEDVVVSWVRNPDKNPVLRELAVHNPNCPDWVKAEYFLTREPLVEPL